MSSNVTENVTVTFHTHGAPQGASCHRQEITTMSNNQRHTVDYFGHGEQPSRLGPYEHR